MPDLTFNEAHLLDETREVLDTDVIGLQDPTAASGSQDHGCTIEQLRTAINTPALVDARVPNWGVPGGTNTLTEIGRISIPGGVLVANAIMTVRTLCFPSAQGGGGGNHRFVVTLSGAPDTFDLVDITYTDDKSLNRYSFIEFPVQGFWQGFPKDLDSIDGLITGDIGGSVFDGLTAGFDLIFRGEASGTAGLTLNAIAIQGFNPSTP